MAFYCAYISRQMTPAAATRTDAFVDNLIPNSCLYHDNKYTTIELFKLRNVWPILP